MTISAQWKYRPKLSKLITYNKKIENKAVFNNMKPIFTFPYPISSFSLQISWAQILNIMYFF